MEDIGVFTPTISTESAQQVWRSCCFIVDKRVVFSSQLSISPTVLIFCMIQLYHSTSCEKDNLYSAFVSLILGCWLPSPVGAFRNKEYIKDIINNEISMRRATCSPARSACTVRFSMGTLFRYRVHGCFRWT